MKDNWERVKLGKLLKLQGGFAFASSMFQDDGIPLIRISNISSSGIYRDFVYLPNEFEKKYSEFSLNENDILIAMSGATTGKNCKITIKHLPALLNQRTGRFQIFSKENLDNDYLYYVVNSDSFQTNLLIDAIGGAQPNISSKQIENLSINLPPLPQQRKIAQILSTVDAVIEKTEAAIAKYQQLKQGLMHDVFTRGIDVNTGQLRPKQTDASELYKQSPLGWIPKEWETIKSEQLLYMKGRIGWQGLKASEFLDEGNYLVTGIHFNNRNRVDWSKCYRINDSRYAEAPEIQLKEGDVLITKDGTIGKIALIDKLPGRSSLNSHLLVLRPLLKNYSSLFLYYSLMDLRFNRFIESIKTGSTLAGLTQSNFGKYDFVIPETKEQTLIIERLQAIENKIFIEEDLLAKYQQLKAGLLQDLLTGKVAVNV